MVRKDTKFIFLRCWQGWGISYFCFTFIWRYFLYWITNSQELFGNTVSGIENISKKLQFYWLLFLIQPTHPGYWLVVRDGTKTIRLQVKKRDFLFCPSWKHRQEYAAPEASLFWSFNVLTFMGMRQENILPGLASKLHLISLYKAPCCMSHYSVVFFDSRT